MALINIDLNDRENKESLCCLLLNSCSEDSFNYVRDYCRIDYGKFLATINGEEDNICFKTRRIRSWINNVDICNDIAARYGEYGWDFAISKVQVYFNNDYSTTKLIIFARQDDDIARKAGIENYQDRIHADKGETIIMTIDSNNLDKSNLIALIRKNYKDR